MIFSFIKPKITIKILERTLNSVLILAFLVSAMPKTALAKNTEIAKISTALTGAIVAAVDVPDGGTGETFPISGEREALRTLNVFATAYSSDPWQTDSTPCLPAMASFDLCENYKKTGVEDTIAANFLPLGTKVRFPDLYGNRIFTVRDRMNKRYNYSNIGYYRLDFYMAALDEDGEIDNDVARQKARDFGFKRNIKMEIL